MSFGKLLKLILWLETDLKTIKIDSLLMIGIMNKLKNRIEKTISNVQSVLSHLSLG